MTTSTTPNTPASITTPDPIKLDFGCGKRKQPGFLGVDVRPFEGVDIVENIVAKNPDGSFKQWRWADNSVDEIYNSHFIEHLQPAERIHFVNECYRILKPGAKMTMIAPHWASNRSYGDLTHCFSEDTEILTEDGWKLITNVKVGEKVPVLNLETEETILSPVLKVINEPYVGKMIHFKTKCLDLLTTPNHDMVWRSKGNGKKYKRPILNKSQAETFLTMGGHHPRRGVATMNWIGDNPETIKIAEDEIVNGKLIPGTFNASDFMKLIGWFISGGNIDLNNDGHYRIIIAQSRMANKEKVEQICSLIKRLGFTPQVKEKQNAIIFNSKAIAKYLKPYDTGSFNKSIPPELKKLSSNLLRDLLETANLGDGTPKGSGWCYATTSESLSNDIHEIALKAGYRCTVSLDKRKDAKRTINGHEFITATDIYLIYITKAKDFWYPVPETITYSGKQVCVFTQDHHNIMVRRNGKPIWSGNCYPPIAEMWFFYLSKAWRDSEAPHNDTYTCDFICTWGYSMHNSLLPRNQEYQQYALANYKEAAQDIVATLQKPVAPQSTI